jgi:hypothetical protein
MKNTDDIEKWAADQQLIHSLLGENQEPHVCSVFGCGRELTAQEYLYGTHCTAHNGQGAETIKQQLL